MPALTRDQTEEIAQAFCAAFPEQDPFQVGRIDLRQRLIVLESLYDDLGELPESTLEDIQIAWYKEWKFKQQQDRLPRRAERN